MFYREAFWSSLHEIALKLLGLYEQNILEFLNEKQFDTFISIGAAEGYHAVSLVKQSLIKRSFCIEKDLRNFMYINNNVKLNLTENQMYL